MQAARRVPVDERLPQRTRLRKRGPRSLTARERRGQRKPQPAEHLDSSFASTVFSANDLVIVQFNLRGFLSKCVELDAYLRVAGPDIVCLTETHLDPSVGEIALTGYDLISRRDREDGRTGGGIAVFALKAISSSIVHIESSTDSERAWHIVHGTQCSFLLGCWYRPPKPGDITSISSFDDDLVRLSDDCAFTIVVGDLNVHNIDWLNFSANNSREGKALHDVACSHGLEQFMKEPTRDTYLLDLILSDCDFIKAVAIPGFSDHLGTKATIKFATPEEEVVERFCFNYKKADWAALNAELKSLNWRAFLGGLDVDDAVAVFTRELLRLVKSHVPSRMVSSRSSSHPWLTQRCAYAVQEKLRAVGTPMAAAKREDCARVLREEYELYVQKTKGELESMEPSSKRWWSVSNSLLRKPQSTCSVPSLKRQDGTWATTSAEKAAVLQATFARKSMLPPIIENKYTPPFVAALPVDEIFCVDHKDVLSALEKLRIDSGTGPDQISTKVLRHCAASIVEPVSLICNMILDQGRWPAPWRNHWVCPLHKKKSKADAGNYRGVHLTSQLSKTCERILGQSFQRFFEESEKYGPRQFAYMKGRGHRDALLANILQWLWWLETGNVVGLYCSDVSGAFDRVDRELLTRKLRSSGLSPCLVRVLESWLDDRVAEVVVGGQAAAPAPLRNSVYQGTVWGPPLWNLHYESARHSVNECGFREVVYADDKNMSKAFANSTPAVAIHNDMRKCQRFLHEWGKGNGVLFDPGKEEFHILNRPGASVAASSFRLLGVQFDSKLQMKEGVRVLCVQAAWRIKALRRVRRFYSIRHMVQMYKSRVLSYIEAGCVAFLHAAPSILEPLDRIQSRFLRFLGISVEAAFLEHNLAPPSVRRQISALGLIHRCVLDKAPTALREFFPEQDACIPKYTTRLAASRHGRQIYDFAEGGKSKIFKRSAFGSVLVYNRLPQFVVDASSVSKFQGWLQSAVRNCLIQKRSRQSWLHVLCRSMSSMDVGRFQQLFANV